MLNSINTNIAAYFAQQNINSANNSVSSSVGRLSSGSRIVRASDDVAAMSVGTSLRSTVSTLKMGLLNASQGSSVLQVADGALGKIQDMLLRQKALSTQATSGSLTATERGFLDQEFQNLTLEIDRLVQNTNFNGVKLLDGTLGGVAATLAEEDTVAAALQADGEVASANVAIQAFDMAADDAAGAVAPFNGGTISGAGQIALTDKDGNVLADDEYLAVSPSIIGGISNINFSNFEEGVSVQVSLEINGITFTGTATDNAGNAGSFTVKNGNTYITVGYADMDLTSSLTAKTTLQQLRTDLQDIAFMQTRQIDGVDFNNTALEGVTFAAASGTVMLRTATAGDVSITDFKYVSNNGAVNTNSLSVQVNGETWYAFDVPDEIADGELLTFTNGKQEALQIDLAGLDTTIDDIRTDMDDRAAFINALNAGFAGLNKGVDFALGTEITDKLTVSIARSSTSALFGGESINVTTVENAQKAGEVLNHAIDTVTAIRANVGAMMSRFDFASANIEIALQNQDAARGTLLDTDIAAESSAYATAQVQLQAGIAVLAQANQLPQNLLKLIG